MVSAPLPSLLCSKRAGPPACILSDLYARTSLSPLPSSHTALCGTTLSCLDIIADPDSQIKILEAFKLATSDPDAPPEAIAAVGYLVAAFKALDTGVTPEQAYSIALVLSGKNDIAEDIPILGEMQKAIHDGKQKAEARAHEQQGWRGNW